jgi:hypothetical protein
MPSPHRFNDMRLDFIWAGIETLDTALQHALLHELATVHARSALSPRSDADKVRAGVFKLRDVAEILGHSPTIHEYEKCRAAIPELDLPANGTVRRWLGGNWNACLARALLDTVTDGDEALRPIGLNQRFEDGEILDAVRECASARASLAICRRSRSTCSGRDGQTNAGGQADARGRTRCSSASAASPMRASLRV